MLSKSHNANHIDWPSCRRWSSLLFRRDKAVYTGVSICIRSPVCVVYVFQARPPQLYGASLQTYLPAGTTNAQVIHTRQTYRSFFLIHNQSSQTFGLLHATIKQNDVISYGFPVSFWPWIGVKVVQTRIILLSSVVPGTIPSLEPIGLQVFWRRPVSKLHFIKLCK